jgi:hypothetical protein
VPGLPRAQEERNLDPRLVVVERLGVLDGADSQADPSCGTAALPKGGDELVDEVGTVEVNGERLHGIDYRQPRIGSGNPIG